MNATRRQHVRRFGVVLVLFLFCAILPTCKGYRLAPHVELEVGENEGIGARWYPDRLDNVDHSSWAVRLGVQAVPIERIVIRERVPIEFELRKKPKK